MHDDQISIEVEQVAALIEQRLPGLAGLRIEPVQGAGTVNAVFRIGDRHAARFPLRLAAADEVDLQLRAEAEAAAEFRQACTVAAPAPIAIGRPGCGYPLPWSVQTWIDGSPVGPTTHAGAGLLAADVAELIRELRIHDTAGRSFAGEGRGGDLRDHDAWVDECIERSEALLDNTVMRALWSQFRVLPREDPDAMSHTDLTPFNLLASGERLVGVVDTSGFQAADPALDLVAAWHLFDDAPRRVLRHELGCSELQWQRGAAWAFQQAIGAYWYYVETNPAMAEMGRTTLGRIVSEFS